MLKTLETVKGTCVIPNVELKYAIPGGSFPLSLPPFLSVGRIVNKSGVKQTMAVLFFSKQI